MMVSTGPRKKGKKYVTNENTNTNAGAKVLTIATWGKETLLQLIYWLNALRPNPHTKEMIGRITNNTTRGYVLTKLGTII
jgi:hypothetical protein